MMSLITTAEKNQKRLLTGLLGYIMRKEDLQNLTLTGYIEGKRDREKLQVTYLTSLRKKDGRIVIARNNKGINIA